MSSFLTRPLIFRIMYKHRDLLDEGFFKELNLFTFCKLFESEPIY